MASYKQITAYCLYILLALVIVSTVSCGRFGRSSDKTSEVTPIPSGTPAVAYGSSLSEWEEATQGDAEQGTTNIEQDTNAQQITSPLAASPLTVSPLAKPTPSEDVTASDIGTPFRLNNTVYRQIMWDGLIPMGYTADAIMAKYADQLAEIEDGSPEATELFSKMQIEFNNAPVNEMLNEIPIRLPGFIAPLEYTDDRITEFLLVPYFGACIHVPPPPANQTVLVKTAEGQGIRVEDSYNPIWVMGRLSAEATTTELAAAGYSMQEAFIEPYTVQQ